MPSNTMTTAAGNVQRQQTENLDAPATTATAVRDTAQVAHHNDGPPELDIRGPVPVAWREGTLTRAQELESLCDWITDIGKPPCTLVKGVRKHIEAARQAASVAELRPKKLLRPPRFGSLRERAMSNLDAAEAHLLNIAPADYLLGQMPSLLQHVRSHLVPGDPRREELEYITDRIGFSDPRPNQCAAPVPNGNKQSIVEKNRVQIVAAVRAASSAALREQVRLRSFRDVLVATTVVMSLLAIGLAIIGWQSSALLPLCFAPEEAGSTVVVCPTQQSAPFPTVPASTGAAGTSAEDIDTAIAKTVQRWDVLLVELIGLTAAVVASAAAIRKIHGSSERIGVPLALAALKLPTGAMTALLGLLLMRGQFIPGLSALDTSAQILAWALVFGYAQQLFTRLVDEQGQTVLNRVGGANNAPSSSTRP